MIFVTIAIYAGAIFFCVGVAAGALRFWIRHQPHGPTDAHYLVVAVTLVLSAGFGALLCLDDLDTLTRAREQLMVKRIKRSKRKPIPKRGAATRAR